MHTGDFIAELVRGERADLLARAAGIAAALPDPTPGSEVAFAFGHDRDAFAAALLGTWMRGHAAALPADASRHSVAPVLHRPKNVAFLHDTGVGRGLFVPTFEGRTGPDALQLESLDADRPLLLAFPAEIAEPARVLSGPEVIAAVDAAVARLGLDATRVALACPLTPTPWDSLLVGLLAPLRLGLCFQPLSAPEWPTACAAIESLGATAALLSAAHLRALSLAPGSAAPALDQAILGPGTLDRRASDRLAERLPRGLGACDAPTPEARQAADVLGAVLEIDGVVDATVRARPVDGAVDRAGGLLVGIQVDPGAGEAQLEAVHAAVARCVPNGTHEVRLLRALAGSRGLRRGPNGEIEDADLYLAFGLGRDGHPVTAELELERLESSDGKLRVGTCVPHRYASYEGHFQGHPILAGAVQLERLVLPSFRLAWPDIASPTKLSRLKFAHRILPGDEVEIHLDRKSDDRCSFEIQRRGTTCSSGMLSWSRL